MYVSQQLEKNSEEGNSVYGIMAEILRYVLMDMRSAMEDEPSTLPLFPSPIH